jgi:hypothetical protein
LHEDIPSIIREKFNRAERQRLDRPRANCYDISHHKAIHTFRPWDSGHNRRSSIEINYGAPLQGGLSLPSHRCFHGGESSADLHTAHASQRGYPSR